MGVVCIFLEFGGLISVWIIFSFLFSRVSVCVFVCVCRFFFILLVINFFGLGEFSYSLV